MLANGIRNGSYKFAKSLFVFGFLFLFNSSSIFAQQIITDGNTATNLNINGATTTVTTGTIKNQGAFNSFSRFNVNQNNTVNMIVPSQANFLMNLVHNEASQINGILNSIKNGAIGGNVVFVNPHGIFVGASGVLNVGSLTAITPTQGFMGSVFNAPGVINDSSVNALLNGTAPINSSAEFRNEGLINAATDVRIDTGTFTNSGEINTGAVYQTEKTISLPNVDTGDVVNINKIDSPVRFDVKSGELVVNAKEDITNTGKLNTVGGNNTNAGNIRLVSNVDVFLMSGSEINAVGKGENSNGGNVFISGDDYLSFSDNSKINSTGGKASGDGGSVVFNSKGYLPYAGDVNTYSNKGSSGEISLNANSLVIASNIYSGGADINITSDSMIYVYSNQVLSARNVGSNPYVNQFSALSVGNSGNININTQSLKFCPGSKLLSFANNGHSSGNVNIKANLIDLRQSGSSINAGSGSITLSRYTAGDIYISNSMIDEITEPCEYLLNSSTSGKLIANNLNIGNNSSTNSLTNTINVYSDLNGANVNLNANNNIFGYKGAVINASNNINLLASSGNIGKISGYLKINEGSKGTITATAKNNIYLKEMVGDMRINQIKSTGNGDVYLAVAYGDVLNASENGLTNVIANDLIIRSDIGQYYFIGIYDDPFNENPEYNTIDLYLDTFKNLGENWESMPEENFTVFNTNDGALNKQAILNAFNNISNKLEPNDVLVIIYSGHGGYESGPDYDPVDENNGIALNTVDEAMGFNEGFSIRDDEFANSLKGTKGNIVFLTEQCYGGGMFGGNYDLDQVAERENFKYFGVTGTKEGYVGWATPYEKLNYNYAGIVNQALLNTLLDENPQYVYRTPVYNVVYNFGNPYDADGNVYLSDWFKAIDVEETFYIGSDPFWFENFTNMSKQDILSIPIILANFSGTFNNPRNIGQAHNPLTVQLTGKLTAYSQDLISISGSWNGEDLHSNTNNIILNGFPLQSEASVARDLAVIQEGSTLDMMYNKEVFDMITYPDFSYFDQPAPFFTNYDNNVYLDITFENYTKNILNSVVESYVEVYENTNSEQQALEIAAIKMENAKFTPEIVAILIKRKSFNRNDQMVKIMEYFIKDRTLKVSNGY